MKRFISFFVVLTLLLLLCSCSENKGKGKESSTISSSSQTEDTLSSNTPKKEEPKSVPDNVVLENVSLSENEKYEISHNYEESNKTDNVTLTISYNGNYGSRIKKYSFCYQYDNSADLWNQADGENGLLSDEISYNESAFKSSGHFTGRFSRYETGSYDIVIESLDFNAKSARVNYCLTFDRDSEQIKGETTSEIVKGSSSDMWAIIIKYNRSVVVQFEQAFVIDIDKGLYAYE